MSIKVFSLEKIDRDIKRWNKMFPEVTIERCYIPSDYCYTLFKYEKMPWFNYPLEAVIGSQKGFVEGWIGKENSIEKVFRTIEVENILKELHEEGQLNENAIIKNKYNTKNAKFSRDEIGTIDKKSAEKQFINA